jgi:organic radical activating enzyme
MSALVVAEVFGPTLQGEGPNAGRRAAFVRLGGCNLHCVWCDTPYTWDARRYDLRAELRDEDVAAIIACVEAADPYLVVVTGGEPLLHQSRPGWAELLAGLGSHLVEIETNGTRQPSTDTLARPGVRFNVSPKLAHSGDPEFLRIAPAVLARFSQLAYVGRAVLKFVVRPAHLAADVAEVDELVARHDLPASAVWLMPEATTGPQVAASMGPVMQAAIDHGYSATSRLHVLAWGTERGR